jgi:hypothetical protein
MYSIFHHSSGGGSTIEGVGVKVGARARVRMEVRACVGVGGVRGRVGARVEGGVGVEGIEERVEERVGVGMEVGVGVKV